MKVNFFWLLIFAGFVPNAVISQVTGIQFKQGMDWAKVLEIAKASHKSIFVDCYASWCGPCKRMDQDVYSNETVGKYYNERFICVRLQMDSTSKDADDIRSTYSSAHSIRNTYRVDQFPTFLFFSPNGDALHRGVGYQSVQDLIKLGEDALKSDEQYYTLKRCFEEGILNNPVELRRLATLAANLQDDTLAARASDQYIGMLGAAELLTKNNIDFMYRFTKTSHDRGFSIFKDSLEKVVLVEPRISRSVSRNLVEGIIYKEEILPYEKTRRGRPDWKKIKANIKKYDTLGRDAYDAYSGKIVFTAYIEPVLQARAEWNDAISLIKKERKYTGEFGLVTRTVVFYKREMTNGVKGANDNFVAGSFYLISRYKSRLNSFQLNDLAWAIFQHDSSEEHLNLALEWARASVDSATTKDPWKSDYVDTYANLLYRLGRKSEAINWEEQAISLRPKDSREAKTLIRMEHGDPTW